MGKSFSLEKLFVCTLFLIALTDQGSTRASSRQSSIGEEASDDGGSYGGRGVHELKQTQQERNNNSELIEKGQEQMQGNETNFGSLYDDEVEALKNLLDELGLNNSHVDVNASFCRIYEKKFEANINVSLFTPDFAPSTTFGCDNQTRFWHIIYISLKGDGNTVKNEAKGDGNTVKNEAEGGIVDTAPPYLLNDICSFTQLKRLQIVNIPLTASAILNLLSLNKLQKLVLNENGLAGSIPSELDFLKNLKYLDLSQNNLQGPIPDTLGNLSMLTKLDLSQNKLEGPIPPTLGNLTMLTKLELRNNQLTGEIPDNFKKLSNLEILRLSRNFINGSASFLGNLSSLRGLDLSQNNFTGEIPLSLGKLVSLEYLYLDNNLFSGNIPSELGKLTNLTWISIGGNILSGPLPVFSKLTQVQFFEVGGNYLTGPIPKYIANWTDLFYLGLLGNNFTSIPVGIFNLPSLEYMLISDVQITTPFKIPDTANLTDIRALILRKCSIGGDIPAFIGNWTDLSFLDLSFNQLEGTIPDSLNDTSLTHLYLTGNKLNGSIPDWISKKIKITNKTDLSFNNFNEQDPNHNKQEMNLTHQQLNFINEQTIKNLSQELCKHRAKNRKSAINSGGAAGTYEGTFYEADESVAKYNVSESKKWAYICLGAFILGRYNSSAYIKNLTCSANIPDEPLHKRARFCPGELTYYGFCFAKGSYTVKLYFAEIVYANTFDYSILNRRIFDVYVQDKRILQDFNIKDRAGGPNKQFIFTYKDAKVKDDNLLKIHFVWKGKGTDIFTDAFNGPLISAISVTPKYPLTKKQTIAAAFITVIGLVLAFAFLWRTGMIGDRNTRREVIELHGRPYSLEQLLAATRNFSDKKVIGKGLFGKVYQADFPNPDKKVYVVKKLHHDFMEKQGGQIRQEFFTLRRLDHENIVPLLDGYWKGDLTLLIYEYMESGSLETALFGESSVSILKNNWEARLNVCKDIVKGLKYLHEDSTFQITHGDIKANNVLLDGPDPPTAKLSDFGLAKFYEEENPFSVTKDKREMQLIAPGQVSTIPTVKADVYSFGMLLLEIISGRRVFEINDKGEAEYLLPKATQLFRDHKAEKLVDSKLRIEDRKQAASLVKLALKCVDVVPDHRPTMSQVLAALESLKTEPNNYQASTSWGTI